MEAIGAAASIFTILATARNVFNAGRVLYEAIDEAPNQLRSVSLKAKLVGSILEQVLALRPRMEDGDVQLLPLDLRISLALSLQMSHESLQKLKSLCGGTNERGHLHLRLRWALLEKRAVEKILQQLGDAEKDLVLVLQVLHVHISLIARTSLGAVLAAQDTLSQDVHRMALNNDDYLNRQTTSDRIEEVLDDNFLSTTAESSAQAQGPPRPVEAESEEIVPFMRQSRANRSLRTKSSDRGNDWLQYLGISGALIWYWDQHQSTYAIALRSRLPGVFGQRALSFELSVRQYALSWTNLSLLFGSIGVSMVVPCTSKIFEACSEGDERTVRKLIDSRQASPNDRRGECCCFGREHALQYENESPLFAAVRSGNIRLVQYLLDTGANVNALNEYLRTPLYDAFSYGLLDMARLLVNRRASLDHVDIWGCTVMHDLSRPRNQSIQEWEHYIALPLVKYLVSMSFEDFDTPDLKQWTALSQMAEIGAVNVWSTLLGYGARISGPGKTPSSRMLQCAASGGSTSIMNSVLKSGVSISVSTSDSLGNTLLHYAARSGRADAVELLLDKGAVINAKGIFGETALYIACCDSCVDVVKLLLERGADVNSTDDEGNTPIQCGTMWRKRGNLAILELLIAHGARINARNIWGATSLFKLASSSSWLGRFCEDLFLCLLSNGADPHLMGWSHYNRIEGTAYLCTPADGARLAYVDEDFATFDAFVKALKEHYTEIVVDTDRDVFWDAKEEIDGEGYGCSYESEIRWQEEDAKSRKRRAEYWKRMDEANERCLEGVRRYGAFVPITH